MMFTPVLIVLLTAFLRINAMELKYGFNWLTCKEKMRTPTEYDCLSFCHTRNFFNIGRNDLKDNCRCYSELGTFFYKDEKKTRENTDYGQCSKGTMKRCNAACLNKYFPSSDSLKGKYKWDGGKCFSKNMCHCYKQTDAVLDTYVFMKTCRVF